MNLSFNILFKVKICGNTIEARLQEIYANMKYVLIKL